ncbi:MAG: lysophospholipid acyltransferase family protein [Neisseria sp.]|nr:lysophospholipid acyltransferase family protein [Neisseria sp.]
MAEKALSFDRIRRLIATAVGFVFFGIAGAIFGLTLLPDALNKKNRTLERQYRARRKNAAVWRAFLAYLRISGVLSFTLNGFERLGRPGQVIFCNHPSLLDVLFMVGHVRDVNCIVKKDLLNNPVMHAQILSCGYLPNDESLELIEQADEILQTQCLLIFPEGTRTGWDNRIHLNRGAVSIGLRSAQVITPVIIKMTPPNFKKNQPWYKIPRRKIHYEIMVGEDIDPQTWLREKPLPIAARRLTEYLQNHLQQEST